MIKKNRKQWVKVKFHSDYSTSNFSFRKWKIIPKPGRKRSSRGTFQQLFEVSGNSKKNSIWRLKILKGEMKWFKNFVFRNWRRRTAAFRSATGRAGISWVRSMNRMPTVWWPFRLKFEIRFCMENLAVQTFCLEVFY